MTSFPRIIVCHEAALARITLSHPPLNVIDFQMMDELRDALTPVEQQPQISTILLEGNAKAFSAGVDVAVHTPELIKTMFEKFHGLIMQIVKLSKITIAQVQGACLGGGAELAMVCDMCFTTPDAKWGFPEITLGCYPPVACTALAALVGKRAADFTSPGGHSQARRLPAGDSPLKLTPATICKQPSRAGSIIYIGLVRPLSPTPKKRSMPGIPFIWIKVWPAQKRFTSKNS